MCPECSELWLEPCAAMMPWGRELVPPDALCKPHQGTSWGAAHTPTPGEGQICIYKDLKAYIHLTGFRMILSVK